MSDIVYALATTADERQEAHDFALALNGAHFCAANAKPSILVNSLAALGSPHNLAWITARQDGRLVGVLAEGIHVMPGFHNLNVVGAIDPAYLTDELAVGLIASVTDLLPYDGCCGASWPWTAILAGDSPMLPVILDLYGGEHGDVTQEVYRHEGTGLVQLKGHLRPERQ